MRWLDFEHELLHIDQLLTRIEAQGLVATSLQTWQLTILEYHARLVEFTRMVSNQATESVIHEHGRYLVAWSRLYWSKGRGLGTSLRKHAWEQQVVPELAELRSEATTIFHDLSLRFTPSQLPHVTATAASPGYGTR